MAPPRRSRVQGVTFPYIIEPPTRRTGQSTRQMLTALHGSFYVAPPSNGAFSYMGSLKYDVGRPDLIIVHPAELIHKIRGSKRRLVFDHGLFEMNLDNRLLDDFEQARAYVRRHHFLTTRFQN